MLRERFTALGGEIVAEQKYSEGDKDFSAQLTAIRSREPDVIAATGFYTEAALICVQARPLGLDGSHHRWRRLGSPAAHRSSAARRSKALITRRISPPRTTRPEVQAFVKRYKAALEQRDARGGVRAGLRRDDTHRRRDEESRRHGRPRQLRDAIAATKDFPGVTGRPPSTTNATARRRR